METEHIREAVKDALLRLPIAVNTNYGDAFQPSQWDNTIEKLEKLKADGHQGEVMISSKWALSDEQIAELHAVNPNVWLAIGLNGTDETPRFSMEERIDAYLRVCQTFDRVFLTLRPIIPGRNNTMDVLLPMVEVAARGNKILHHGGFRDPYTPGYKKYVYPELRAELEAACAERGVKCFPKTCCLVADYKGIPCPTCSDSEPQHVDVLRALGYQLEMDENGAVRLLGFRGGDVVTKGDVCFARHICQTARVSRTQNDYHEKMSMTGPDGQTLICTSGWFGWSREWYACEIGCDYCFVRPGLPIHYDAGDAGCSPLDLYNHLVETGLL